MVDVLASTGFKDFLVGVDASFDTGKNVVRATARADFG